MTLIIGFGCFLGGAALGALLFKLLASDEVRVKNLETQLQALSEEHENYKSNVNGHFNTSAQLLNKLTDTYREVYLHMADGARSLCPDYISNQLSLTGDNRSLLERERGNTEDADAGAPVPPLDYAARTRPDQKGNLAEDFGFNEETERT